MNSEYGKKAEAKNLSDLLTMLNRAGQFWGEEILI
jgi:hypothetical protein